MERRKFIKFGFAGITALSGCVNLQSAEDTQDQTGEQTLRTNTPKPLTENPTVQSAKKLLESFINDLRTDLYQDNARIENPSGKLARSSEDPLRLEAHVEYQVNFINLEQFQNDLEYGIGSVAFLFAEYLRRENWEVVELDVVVFKQGDPHLQYTVSRTDARAANGGEISDEEFIERVHESINQY